jgi:hypothetical protein
MPQPRHALRADRFVAAAVFCLLAAASAVAGTTARGATPSFAADVKPLLT